MFSIPSVVVILLLASTSIQTDGQYAPTTTCGRRIAADYKPLIRISLHENHWPWHAAIYHLDYSSSPAYQCGGTVITSNSVLTAARCVFSAVTLLDSSRVSVALGKINLAVNESISQAFGVSKIVPHPNFDSIDGNDDIAIVQLSTEAIFNSYVQPICLWPANKIEFFEIVGKKGIVVGWGRLETGKVSTILRKSLLPVVSHVQCLRSNRDVFGLFLHENQFCAGLLNGTSICDFGSGASMIFVENNRYFIRGMVSTVLVKSTGDCIASEYAIFTDIAQYLPWITEVTNEPAKTTDGAQYLPPITNGAANTTDDDTQFVLPPITEMPNACVKKVQCDRAYNQLYNDSNYLRCDVTFNIDLSETNCKIIFAEPANSSVTWLRIEGGVSDAFPDLSDAINKFENLKVLAYRDSKLKFIERSKMATLESIEILSLANNEISQLSRDTFVDLKNLIHLQLDSNKLREVHPDLLMELPNLKSIYLHGNRIEVLPEELFRNNKKLEKISIYNNRIRIIPSDLFANLPNLKKLYLNGNSIEILPEELFNNNRKLEKIWINDNGIKIIPLDLLRNLPNLREIYFSNNQIDFLYNELFRNNPNLQKIDMHHNQLKELHPDTFNELLNLKWLNLNDNQLEVLQDGLFKNNQNLIEIRLQNNKLKIIESEFQHLRNLEGINFEGNVCIDEICDVSRFCGTASMIAMQKKIWRNC